MTRCVLVSSLLTASVCLPTRLAGQTSPYDSIPSAHGICRVWAGIPGFSSSSDSSYSRCALDRSPVLLPGAPMPTPPLVSLKVDGRLAVIVNADGTVDSRLTRMWESEGDNEFDRRALETIARWRFEPGSRRGTPVRSGFNLEFVTTTRNDTLPARLKWTYRRGQNTDTLTGTWVHEAPLPPFAPERLDSLYLALLRRLVRMQVVFPRPGQSYCLVLSSGDSAAQARLSRLAHAILSPGAGPPASYGCERTPGTRRIVLPRVYRTENGRAVLRPSGDYLGNWPPGFDGRAWTAWRSRCVATVPAQGSVWIGCWVEPDVSSEEYAEYWRNRWRPASNPPAERSDGDSIAVRVIVTTRGAYQMDTLHAVLHAVPQLSARAMRDPRTPCGGRGAAYSLQNSSELYVLRGDPAGTELSVVPVTNGPAPAGSLSNPQCVPQKPRTTAFVTFLLGDVGDRANAPITLCFDECAWLNVLDPARHTLAERAHVQFRLSDLREETGANNQIIFRVQVDPAPADVRPLIVIRAGGRWYSSARFARAITANVWAYDNVIWSDGYPPDTEVHIYLIAP